MGKKRKIETFLNDPEVGNLYWADALEKYKDMSVQDMLFKLSCECAERIWTGPMEVAEELPDGSKRMVQPTDMTMYRIYHTLQTIMDKMREEERS